jgi:hypothetical protein
MARTRTITNLVADVRFRADNQAATDAEITELINQSITGLYDLLTNAFGDEYFEIETSLSTVAGNDSISLAGVTDFYKITGVWWLISGGQYARISQYQPANSQTIIPSSGWNYDANIYYRLRANALRFVPTPLGVHTVKLKYVPWAVRLNAPPAADTFDGYNGWEEYPVVDAAIKLLEREGNTDDAQLLMARKQELLRRIQEMADRDLSEPSRIQDTRSARAYWRGRW